ncbi:tectonin beta-propeller repeat-containing protein isoform X3 [Onthophagus taurus]|uniref:tectonin beta-propeller repeat-containing protein isoform X3 n=1 Tax=Onthophagus taurus TaxID=166361 RepID=UPI000C204CC4|nr:tectonin beta-propeller repeat-containing protein isoform X2 [Onthophagus taurus]
MPTSLLFGINNEGRVHTLSTSGSMWRELTYVGQEFKKLSAVPHFLWALGGDHQIYVYVHGLDVPIKVREESYENERWIPIEGFSSRLLPTDRYHFSNIDGTIDRSTDKIRLPSMAWQWEGEWQLELTLDGQPLDHNGWMYAVDFPANYYPKKQWKSCVRRRLWVRTRRYAAMNSWCAIAPLHKDATAEPFIDISIGGQFVAGAEIGTMLVWSVTSHNRVMFRTGVTTRSPEGAKWTCVSVPPGCEVCQLSVGPTGLVWAALLDGRALVRIGVTRECLSGNVWVETRGPSDGLRIMQISVGVCCVWAVTHDKQVWFRKGVKADGAVISEENAVGCGWVEMVGKMSSVSVAANDQVLAVGADDRAVYFRTGITGGDLTGKKWKSLHAPLQVSRASSNASLNRDRLSNSTKSTSSLNRPHSLCDTTLGDITDQSHSAPTSLPVGDMSNKFETQLKNPRAWSPVRSVGSIVGTEVHPESDESLFSDKADSCIFAEDEELGWAEYEAPWSFVAAGACTLDLNQLPNWFAEQGNAQHAELEQPWRLKILEDLRLRLDPDDQRFNDYPLAVDTSSWVHTGEARVNLNGNTFVDCVVQLEWVHTSGTLTILNSDGATTMHQFSLNEITCVQSCSEPGCPRLSIHTPNLTIPIVRLQFGTDAQMEELQAHFTTVCSEVHLTRGKASSLSVWAVTTLGDIFVYDAKDTIIQHGSYELDYELTGKQLPLEIPLHTSCVPETVIIINGCLQDDITRFAINLDAYPSFRSKHKNYTELENCCLHFNPRFENGNPTVVRNSMIDGKWGEEERVGITPFMPGQEFELKIEVNVEDYVIYVDGERFCGYRHRLPVGSCTSISFWGQITLEKMKISTPKPIVNLKDIYWRQFGGHLRRVETCKAGVTWGIGYDHTCWVYNGGFGGNFAGTLNSNNLRAMADTQDYRVYENQRWNPVTGYTSAGLPTDRYMWSDVTGKQRRTKDQVKLLSVHWQWVSDWLVDFHVPGGADKEGWQYAVDFPASYHAHKHFTDYVRRRRWYRRCAIGTTGPWQDLGHTKLLDVSFCTVHEGLITVWALATGGQAMIRTEVSISNPTGNKWEHVNSDKSLTSISCGPFNNVWATASNGSVFVRHGITMDLIQGVKWICIEPPPGNPLKEISVNQIGVWAVSDKGKLYVRKDISYSWPEGSVWHCIEVDPLISGSTPLSTKFKHVSVAVDEVWATTDGGLVLRRLGICEQNCIGTGWDIGINGNFQQISVRALT